MDYSKYIEVAKEVYKDEPSGHDYGHIERCLSFAKEIQKAEGGDEFVVVLATLFHDVHRVISSKISKFVPAENAMSEVEEILSQFDLQKDVLDKILFIIKEHDNKNIDASKNIELQIVQDADILDALGSVGLERTKKYCKKHNIPLYSLQYPLNSDEYIPNINPISTTHYVYRTMIPQINLIKTQTGKTLAEKQVKILKQFVDENIQNYNLSL